MAGQIVKKGFEEGGGVEKTRKMTVLQIQTILHRIWIPDPVF